MRREAISMMLVAMRAQIDAILINLEQEELAEANRRVCSTCGSDNLKAIQTMGNEAFICMNCGANQ